MATAGRMTYFEAAISVLKNARRPLTTKEITDTAILWGLIQPRGKTPIATMGAKLYMHARDARNNPIRRQYRRGSWRAVKDPCRWFYNGCGRHFFCQVASALT